MEVVNGNSLLVVEKVVVEEIGALVGMGAVRKPGITSVTPPVEAARFVRVVRGIDSPLGPIIIMVFGAKSVRIGVVEPAVIVVAKKLGVPGKPGEPAAPALTRLLLFSRRLWPL